MDYKLPHEYLWRDPKNAAGLAVVLCKLAMKSYDGGKRRWLNRSIAYVEWYARGRPIDERMRENAMTLSNKASVRNMGGHAARNAVVHATYMIGGEPNSINNLERVVEYAFASDVPADVIDQQVALWQIIDITGGQPVTEDVRDAMTAACQIGHHEVAEAIFSDAEPPPPKKARSFGFGWHFGWVTRIWSRLFA